MLVEERVARASREAWRLLAAAIVLQTAFSTVEMGLPTLAGFIKSDLGLSASTAGLAISTYLIGKVTGSYVAGRLADHVGEARVLVAGSIAAGVIFLIAAETPFPILFAFLGLAGLAGSGATPAGGSLVRNAFPPHERGMALGLRQTGIPVGGLIAAGVLPWIAHAEGWRWSLRVAALVCVCGTLPLVRSALAGRTGVGLDTLRVKTRVVTREVWLVSLWGAVAVTGQFALLVFVPLDLHARKHLSLASAASLAAVLQVAGIVGRIGWGWASDRAIRFGRNVMLVVLTVGGVLSSAMLFVLPSSASLVLYLVAIVLAGVTVLGFQGIWVTIVTEMVPSHVVGRTMGFAVTLTIAGGAAAPPVFGAIADVSGSYRPVWALLAGVMLLSLAPALALVKEERGRR